MKVLERRALLGLLAGVCALAFPGVAAATVNPNLTLTPASGTAGATGQTLNYGVTFTPGSSTPSDSPASLTTMFPVGMLGDLTIDGGKCLTQTVVDPACKIATGTVTLGPPVSASPPANEYLVAPPHAGDIAGILLTVTGSSGPTPVSDGDATVQNGDALQVAFSNLPGPTSASPQPQILGIHLAISDLRLPSNCSAEQMVVNTVSENGDSETSNAAPYASTGCPSQPYAPQVNAHVNALPNGGAEVLASITQNANEAASKSIELDLPSSLTPNLLGDAGCLQGTSCQIGTATATSPLSPVPLNNGTVTLGGTLSAPTLTVAFPAPTNLMFVGNVNTGNNTVTVQNAPDVPISALSLDIKNTPFGQAFTTNCAPGSVVGKFSGQGGQSSTVNAPISYSGCSTPPPTTTTVGSPTASGHLSGLKGGHPQLHLHLIQGDNAPDLSKVAIGLGSGLKFSSKGLVKRCTGHGRHHKCSIKAKGLTVSGAIKSVKLVGGKLVITLKHPVARTSLTIHGPLLVETKALQKKAKKHKAGDLPVRIKVTDTSGNATAIPLLLKG